MRSHFDIVDGFFVFILIGLSIAFYRVLSPFIIDIFLAVVLANIFWRPFSFLKSKLFRKRTWGASAITVILVLIIIGGILTFIIYVFSSQVAGGVQSLRERWPELKGQLQGIDIKGFLQKIPFSGHIFGNLETFKLTTFIDNALVKSSNLLMQLASRSFTSASGFVIHFLFTLFILLFVLIDGERVLETVKDLIPLSDRDTNELTHEIGSMTKATVISTIIIGFIEGTYGAVLFTIFGLPSPLLWGIIILFISIIPVIGANIIIVPAGIIKIIAGQYISGLLIIILGIAGIAVTQNIVKPKLLGGRTGLHPMIVLLSTLGGIAWLGLIGFLLGPLIASLFIVMWNQFGKRFRRELDGKNRERD